MYLAKKLVKKFKPVNEVPGRINSTNISILVKFIKTEALLDKSCNVRRKSIKHIRTYVKTIM